MLSLLQFQIKIFISGNLLPFLSFSSIYLTLVGVGLLSPLPSVSGFEADGVEAAGADAGAAGVLSAGAAVAAGVSAGLLASAGLAGACLGCIRQEGCGLV